MKTESKLILRKIVKTRRNILRNFKLKSNYCFNVLIPSKRKDGIHKLKNLFKSVNVKNLRKLNVRSFSNLRHEFGGFFRTKFRIFWAWMFDSSASSETRCQCFKTCRSSPPTMRQNKLECCPRIFWRGWGVIILYLCYKTCHASSLAVRQNKLVFWG